MIMSRTRVSLTRIALACALVLATFSRAAAQTQVEAAEQATIWSSTFLSLAAVVPPGTVLDVVGRRGQWYEVILPASAQAVSANRTGFISATQVRPLNDDPVPSSPRAGTPPGSQAPPGAAATENAQRRESSGALSRPGVRPFAQVGLGHFAASQSFDAVMGSANGFWFGGGIQIPLQGNLFLQGSLELFRRKGERVFVFEDEVFPLGIEHTVTLVPVSATFGVRQPRAGVAPYAGIGAGVLFHSESSELSLEDEDASDRFLAFHVLGGLDFSRAAVEVQYSHVPDALESGVAAHFDERNLGGFQLRFKVYF
ncbi:MAG: hypothetical protein AB7F99_00530 [Vicinamibacterales bacterium]